MIATLELVRRFNDLLSRAGEGEKLPTAMSLATVDDQGRPAVRMVLLKGFDERGLVFYTNYGSRKAAELDGSRLAALCFHWPSLGAQVRAEGPVVRVSPKESDAYFATRPRISQIGAWASRQSEPLSSRDELLRRFHEIEARYPGQTVPRPPFWGGYRLDPQRIEFWQEQAHRLHDRDLYVRQGAGWTLGYLYP